MFRLSPEGRVRHKAGISSLTHTRGGPGWNSQRFGKRRSSLSYWPNPLKEGSRDCTFPQGLRSSMLSPGNLACLGETKPLRGGA